MCTYAGSVHQIAPIWGVQKSGSGFCAATEVALTVVYTKVLGVVQLLPVVEMVMVCTKVVGVGAVVVVQATLV